MIFGLNIPQKRDPGAEILNRQVKPGPRLFIRIHPF